MSNATTGRRRITEVTAQWQQYSPARRLPGHGDLRGGRGHAAGRVGPVDGERRGLQQGPGGGARRAALPGLGPRSARRPRQRDQGAGNLLPLDAGGPRLGGEAGGRSLAHTEAVRGWPRPPRLAGGGRGLAGRQLGRRQVLAVLRLGLRGLDGGVEVVDVGEEVGHLPAQLPRARVAGVEPRGLSAGQVPGSGPGVRVVVPGLEVDVGGEEAEQVLGVAGLGHVHSGLRLLQSVGIHLSRRGGSLLKLRQTCQFYFRANKSVLIQSKATPLDLQKYAELLKM